MIRKKPRNHPTDPYLYDTERAAQYLDVHPNTLIRWRRARPPKGPEVTREGRECWYTENALRSYERAQYLKTLNKTRLPRRGRIAPDGWAGHNVAASYLGMTSNYLYTLRARGLAPPATQWNWGLYYQFDGLDAWVADPPVARRERKKRRVPDDF